MYNIMKRLSAAVAVFCLAGHALVAQDPGDAVQAAKIITEGRAAGKAVADSDAKVARLARAEGQAELQAKDAADALAAARRKGKGIRDAAAAKSRADARVASLEKDYEQALSDAEKVADANKWPLEKLARLEQRKLALERESAAQAAARAEDAKLEAGVEPWRKADADLVKHGQLTAVVRAAREKMPLVEFRYDRFGGPSGPDVERLVMEDGAVFSRTAGGGWMIAPAPGMEGAGGNVLADTRAPAPAERVRELDAAVVLAMRALAPGDSSAPAWRHAPRTLGGMEVFTRDEGKAGDDLASANAGSAEEFSFTSQPLPENGGFRLARVKAAWPWMDEPAQVSAAYFYHAGGAPSEDGVPEWPLAAALRNSAAKPVRVDASVGSDDRDTALVSGIIEGEDFDFTIVSGGGTRREIAVGGDEWTSEDHGATWRKLEAGAPGRRYYFALLGYALDPAANGAMHWPFFKCESAAGDQKLRLYIPKTSGLPGTPGGEFTLSEANDGKPDALAGYEGSVPDDQGKAPVLVLASYSAAPHGVLPPPAAPAVEMRDCAELLREAVDAMNTGVWRVRRGGCTMDMRGNGAEKSSFSSSGLVSGADYDISHPYYPGGRQADTIRRVISVGGKSWSTTDAGRTWQPGTDDRAAWYYWPASELLAMGGGGGPWQVVAMEKHGSETWLHIRQAGGNGAHFWLQLDAGGKAVALRRFARMALEGGVLVYGAGVDFSSYDTEEFSPAAPGDKIAPPEVAKGEAPAGGGTMKQ